MKKIIFILTLGLVTLFTSSCTEQIRARAFGGELTIQVPKGQKLTMATWKKLIYSICMKKWILIMYQKLRCLLNPVLMEY